MRRRALAMTIGGMAMEAPRLRAAAPPAVRIGVLKFGTVSWEAAVIKAANFGPGDSLAVDAAILEFE